MKMLLVSAFAVSFLACSKKNAAPPEKATVIEEASASDCPPGVKTGCNVPMLTKDEISAIQEANQKCVQECVQARQAEAMDATIIREQCQRTCDQEHFVGQVQVALLSASVVTQRS